MTLTKALAELKLLSKRIDKSVEHMEPVAIRKGNKFDASIKSQKDFEKEVRAKWQSLSDLMARRRKIKTALVVANATTNVTVNGETMTIAEAIERKNMSDVEQKICFKAREKLVEVQFRIDEHNLMLQDKVSDLLQSAYSKREGQLSKEDYDRIAKPFLENNEAKLVDPLNLKSSVEKMEEKYEKFLSEVDVCLSVVNAKTEIVLT